MSKELGREKLNSFTHNIRFSQSLAPFGVGAMIDFPDQTLMAAAPELWRTGRSIRDERLEYQLEVDEFRMPPDSDNIAGLPFVRFPEWYFCPKCKSFKPLKEWEKEYIPSKKAKSNYMKRPMCMECKLQLVPAGIITVCEEGHIDDFPWVKWVHHKSKKSICASPKLKFKTTNSALGLEGLQIQCTTCKAAASMKGSFNADVFENMGEEYRCTGKMPWKGKKEKCIRYPRTVQRGGLNVYFAKVVSSLVIPPYSNDVNVLVENSKQYSLLKENLQDEDIISAVGKDILIKKAVKKIADEIHQSEAVVQTILNRKLNASSIKKAMTKEEYRQEEYDALVGNIPASAMDEKDFKIEIQNISEYNIPELSRVTLVKKLREVRALVGFSRLNPPEQNVIDESNAANYNIKGRLINVKEKETNWYPAYETRGEGIFIEFDNKQIEEWIERNPEMKKRAGLVQHRYNEHKRKLGQSERVITPKFILLHTISHLLIKELSFECGYSSASLSERIYCNTDNNEKLMSGILIYTSSGDSEGTLGGLVRQGKKDMLPHVLANAVRKAQWCSIDPVCIESESQGRDGLNLSACYACTLIAETSCEEFNTLLDRAMVVGTLKNRDIGFFKL